MTLTNTGFAATAVLLSDFEYHALGTGTTAAAATDTTLETETSATGLARSIVDSNTSTTTTVTNDTRTTVTTFTNSSGGTVNVTEAGLFDASSGGTMLDRQVFTAVGVEDGNSLQVTYNVKTSA